MRLLTIFLFVSLWAESAQAQAFCALRNPDANIAQLFPGYGSYRSVVRRIDAGAAKRFSKVDDFSMHAAELGKHTLYLVYDKKQIPMGFVHTRSEQGRWGLDEIAWTLDLNLAVMDYRFQRTRDRERAFFESPGARRVLRGFGSRALRIELAKSKKKQSDGLWASKSTAPLAATLLRSGIKAIELTLHSWETEVRQTQVQHAMAAHGITEAGVEAMTSLDLVQSLKHIEHLQLTGYRLQKNPGREVGQLIIGQLHNQSGYGSLIWVRTHHKTECYTYGHIQDTTHWPKSRIEHLQKHVRACLNVDKK